MTAKIEKMFRNVWRSGISAKPEISLKPLKFYYFM